MPSSKTAPTNFPIIALGAGVQEWPLLREFFTPGANSGAAYLIPDLGTEAEDGVLENLLDFRDHDAGP